MKRQRFKSSACFHANSSKGCMSERAILEKKFNQGDISKDELRRLAELNVEFKQTGTHFKEITVSGEVKFDVKKDDKSFNTIKIKGHKMTFTIEEHKILKAMGFIK